MTVHYKAATYAIKATPNSANYGSVKGSGTYKAGSTCTLTATPKAGYYFKQWTDGGKSVSKSYRYSFSVAKARTLKAEFAKIGTPSVQAVTGYNQITLSWKAVAGTYQYQVYRQAPGEKAYKRIATTTKPTYTNKGLRFNKSYSYRVRSICKAGVTTYGAYATKSARTLPATPTALKQKNAGSRALHISWKKVPGAQGYQVKRITFSTGEYSQIRFTKRTSLLNTQLRKGRTYYYKVRAWRMEGNKRIYGKYSTVMKVRMK